MRLPSPAVLIRLVTTVSAPALAVSLAVLLSACAAPPVAAPADAPLTVRLIAFNDFHGHLEAGDNSLSVPDPAQPQRALKLAAGGAPALAGLVQRLRADAPHSLLISSGDLVGAAPMVSTLFRHESTVDVMNRIGLDLGTTGNHEYDAGLPELQRLLGGGCAAPHPTLSSCALGPHATARFPIVTANVRRADGSTPFAPYVVREWEGVKVGFIGAVTRTTPSIVSPSGVAGLRFEDEATALNRAAAELDALGVHAIVAVVHEGGEIGLPGQRADWNDPSCPGARGDLFEINRRLSPRIDVLLSAHTHQGYRCVIDGRPVMQALSYGRGVSVVDLVLDRRSGEVDRAASRSRNLPVLNERSDLAARAALLAAEPAPWAQVLREAQPDAAIAQRVAAYAAVAAPRVNRPIGRIGAGFVRQGTADSPATRLIADAQWAATRDPALGGADLALTNPGGARTDLLCPAKSVSTSAPTSAPTSGDEPPGSGCTVTYGQAFAMQPFGNSLVVLTLTGRELKALLESQRRGAGEPLLLTPSSNLRYRWQRSAPAGQQVSQLTLNGQPVSDTQRLRVTVNSFLADGGDGFGLLRQGRERLGGAQDLDALVDYLGAAPRQPDPQARVEVVQ